MLNGSIRDDGPLPEVFEHTYIGQDTIRSHVRKATTVIGMATVLHTIAAGNMTPTYRVLEDGTIRPLYFYMVVPLNLRQTSWETEEALQPRAL